jgi:hypothetical protein
VTVSGAGIRRIWPLAIANGMVGGGAKVKPWLSKVSNSGPFSSLDNAVVEMHQVNDDYVILVSSCCEGIAKVTLKAGNLSPFPKSPPLA